MTSHSPSATSQPVDYLGLAGMLRLHLKRCSSLESCGEHDTLLLAADALEHQHYADIEHETLGCPTANTGIYATNDKRKFEALDLSAPSEKPPTLAEVLANPNKYPGEPLRYEPEAVPSATLPPADQEYADLQRDAARYRWLRVDHGERKPFVGRYGMGFSRWTGKHADECIDAAMKEDA